MPITPEIRAEYLAWQEVVRLWPGDINGPESEAVVKAIHAWGNALVAMRISTEARLADPFDTAIGLPPE